MEGLGVGMKLSGKVVLVVDDEAEIRDIFSYELDYLGAKSVQASNGKEGFELFQNGKFDLVISDIRMPGGDGMQLLKLIREKNPQSPPVILLTGFADTTREGALKAGAANLFAKPFKLEEVFEFISSLPD
jgi:DNA-binding response OmpR family regulator